MNLELFHWYAGRFFPSLADHLWQSTFIGLIVLLAVHILRNQSARLRHFLLILGMAKFLFPSTLLVASFELLRGTAIGPPTSVSSTIASFYLQPSVWPELREEQPAVPTAASVGKRSGIYFGLALVWLVGCLVLLTIWVRRRRTVTTLLDETLSVSVGREAAALQRVSGWVLLKRPVRLAMTSGFMEPGVWGIWNPVVLLPQAMAQEMTDSEIESVLLHELTHVERYDNLIAALQRFVCYLFWFHPLVWILDRRMLLEREQVCDELVLSMRIDRKVYAAGIVKATRFCLGGKLTGTSCVTGADLKKRIELIVKRGVLARFTVWQRTLLGSIASGVLVFSLAVGYPLSRLLPAQASHLEKPSQDAELLVKQQLLKVRKEALVSARKSISWLDPEEHPKTMEEIKQVSEVAMNVENKADCPLVITDAGLRWVESHEVDAPGFSFAVQFGFKLSNTSGRRAKRFIVRPFLPDREKLPSEGISACVLTRTIEPFGKLEIPVDPSGLLRTERPEALTIRIEKVEFEDGTNWTREARLNTKQSVSEPSRVRVGEAVQRANLISQVGVDYPLLARLARIEGYVLLEVVISREGHVSDLKVESGPQLLVEPALTAVRQWKYKPTLFKGQPVEVITQVSVPFKL